VPHMAKDWSDDVSALSDGPRRLHRGSALSLRSPRRRLSREVPRHHPTTCIVGARSRGLTATAATGSPREASRSSNSPDVPHVSNDHDVHNETPRIQGNLHTADSRIRELPRRQCSRWTIPSTGTTALFSIRTCRPPRSSGGNLSSTRSPAPASTTTSRQGRIDFVDDLAKRGGPRCSPWPCSEFRSRNGLSTTRPAARIGLHAFPTRPRPNAMRELYLAMGVDLFNKPQRDPRPTTSWHHRRPGQAADRRRGATRHRVDRQC